MMEFLSCACYIVLIGGASFVLGRIVPKAWFHWDKAPFAAYGFERQGKLYEKLGIASRDELFAAFATSVL